MILCDKTWYWPGFLREENKPNPRSWIFLNYCFLSRDGDTGEPGAPLPLTFFFFFCLRSKKKGKPNEKRKSFKAEAIKKLSPRSKCYCFSHCGAPRIQKFFLSANHGAWQYFHVFHGPYILKFILPALLF